MTLTDAIQSGRQFRRPGLSYFILVHNKRLHTEANGIFNPTIDDMLANDWELEERRVILTHSEFDHILANLSIDLDTGILLSDAIFGKVII
jgi:hypothetical protein